MFFSLLGHLSEEMTILLENGVDVSSLSCNSWFPWVSISKEQLLRFSMAYECKPEQRYIIGSEVIVSMKPGKLTVLDIDDKNSKCEIRSLKDNEIDAMSIFACTYSQIVIILPSSVDDQDCANAANYKCLIFSYSQNLKMEANFFIAHRIEQLSVGHAHAIAKADNGTIILTWGCNTRGELGTGSNSVASQKFEVVEQLCGLKWLKVCN